MITVENTFKEAMKKPIKELNAHIKISDTEQITNADDLISFTISCESGLCKTAMRKLEAKFLGSHNILGKWVQVGFGVRIENNNYSYINYGSFLVNEITTSKDTGITTVVAYDKMINSMTKYETLDIEYPIGLYDYTVELCKKCNLELANTNFETHNDWEITKELWENIEGITYRDILQQIAQITCTTAITSNDKLYFKQLTNTNEKLTYDNMKTLKLKPLYGPINSVVLSRTPQEDNIYMKDKESIVENGITEWKIENNEIIDKDRDNAMTPIYIGMKSINYYPFEATTEGLGWYEIADNINIETDNGEIYSISLFNFSITIDGGIKETLRTEAETKTQTQYQYATTIAKRVRNTEIIVNKQENKITQLTQETTEHSEKLTQVEQTVDGINSIVSNHTEKIEEVQEKTNLNTDEIARLGSTVTVEGTEIKVDASKNLAKIYIYGNSEQETNENSPSPENPTPIKNVGENGSIDIKIQNKNLFSTDDIENAYITNAGEYISNKFNAMTPLLKVQKKKISARANNIILAMNFVEYDKNKKFLERHAVNGVSKCTENISLNTEYIRFGLTLDNETEMTKEVLDSLEIQLEEGELTDYIKNEEQIIHFPLEEQVLHKDDYLAEDGIHHKRKTVVLDGTENFTYESAGRIFMVIHDIKDVGKVRTADILSSHFKINNTGEEKTAFHYQKLIYFFPNSDITSLIEWKAWLDEQYEAGTPVTIEYELANEEIVPYTPLQEDVMNSIYTFKGINYILCINSVKPKKLVLTYYPNTPYNETLVNKETFDKVTTDMNAEFNIRANEIETSVKESTTSSILTLLNNGYLTAEQVNALVNGNAEDIVTIKEQLKQTVTSSQMQIEITKAIEGGVSYLKNTLFTIDENGMAIATNQDEFNALYNNKGMYLYSYEEMIAKFDVNGATITGNLTLEGEFITQNLRMINTTVENVKHTHIHWIGG